MPAWYTIDKQRRLVLSAASGVFSLAADALSHHEKLTNDPDFDPRFSQIADFTQVTRFELSADDIQLLAQNGLFSANSRRALVASSEVAFGLARMYGTLRELSGESGGHVFHTLDEALQWVLGDNATS